MRARDPLFHGVNGLVQLPRDYLLHLYPNSLPAQSALELAYVVSASLALTCQAVALLRPGEAGVAGSVEALDAGPVFSGEWSGRTVGIQNGV